MKLTVLVCTHNRAELLMHCIKSINAAAKPEGIDISVLVIANACTDNTINALTRYQDENPELSLSFHEEPNAGKSFALNHGLSLVNNDHICFVDDDQVLDNNYFIETVNAIASYPEASIICGPLLPDWQGDEPEWIHTQGRYRIYPFPIPIFNLGQSPLTLTLKDELPPGGQVIIKKKVFDDVGLFSVNLGPIGHNLLGSEDTDFFQRAINQGKIIQYVPSIIQYHYVDKNRITLKYLLTKCYQRNRSITLSRHPERKPIPLYLIRQFSSNIFKVVTSSNAIKFRFYLMRLSSTLGEIFGLIEKQKTVTFDN